MEFLLLTWNNVEIVCLMSTKRRTLFQFRMRQRMRSI